jgi:hypothetical protein
MVLQNRKPTGGSHRRSDAAAFASSRLLSLLSGGSNFKIAASAKFLVAIITGKQTALGGK